MLLKLCVVCCVVCCAGSVLQGGEGADNEDPSQEGHCLHSLREQHQGMANGMGSRGQRLTIKWPFSDEA